MDTFGLDNSVLCSSGTATDYGHCPHRCGLHASGRTLKASVSLCQVPLYANTITIRKEL